MDEFNRIKFKSLFNTRDLGGMKVTGGGKIADGLIFRSARLGKLSPDTRQALKDLGIKTVIDLRIRSERREKPDVLWDGCAYEVCPLVCTATPGITYEPKTRKTMENEAKILAAKYGSGDNYMVEMYRHMVTDGPSIEALRKFFRILIERDGGILYHCNSGKDRVGICSMLLESLLGVEEHDIIKDYNASRIFLRMKYFWNRVGVLIAPVSVKFKKFLFCLMRIKPSYLEKTIDYINEKYGSVNEFCIKKLALSESDIEKLKNKYISYTA